MGGYGLSDGVMAETLLEHVKQNDLPSIRERIQAAQRRKAESKYGQWGVEAYESFLIQLDVLDNTDPEMTLQRLREQGLYRLLFGKLLSMERTEDAVAVVTEHLTTPYERLQVLPTLSAAGHDDTAVRLAQGTLNNQFDDQLAHWLAECYTTRGDQNALFDLRRACMQHNPVNHIMLRSNKLPRESHPYTRHKLTFDLPVFPSNTQKYSDKSEQRRVIMQLHAQGWSYREIAAEVGLHWTRVGQIVKSMRTNTG